MKFIFFAPVISLKFALSSLTNDTKISNLRVTLLKIKLVGQLHIYLNIVPVVPSISKKSSTSENFNILGKSNQSVWYLQQHICSFLYICIFCLLPSSHCEMRAIHFQELSYTTYTTHVLLTTYTTDGRREIASMNEVVDRVAVNNWITTQLASTSVDSVPRTEQKKQLFSMKVFLVLVSRMVYIHNGTPTFHLVSTPYKPNARIPFKQYLISAGSS